MASSVSVRPRKQIDYKNVNEGEPLPSESKVRVSRVSSESVERIITRGQSDGVSYLFIYFFNIEPRHEKTCLCEQQRCRLAHASAQSVQHLYYSLPG